MKKFAIALLLLSVATPAMAHHRAPRWRRGNYEVEPSHCTYDKLFETWNCWYTPVPKRRHQHRHHHHYHYGHGDFFTPNKHNEHGAPCYFYKKNGWCF